MYSVDGITLLISADVEDGVEFSVFTHYWGLGEPWEWHETLWAERNYLRNI